jgi:hypothetical protein
VKYVFAKGELVHREQDGSSSGWQASYVDGVLELAGSFVDDGKGSAEALGDYHEYQVTPLTPHVLLIGEYPWFLRESDCDDAITSLTE